MFMIGGPAIGIRDVTDGTTNTIAFGEWKIGDGNTNLITVPTDLVYVGSTYPSGVKRNTLQMELPGMGQAVLLQWAQQTCAAGLLADRGNHTSQLGEYWARHHDHISGQLHARSQPEDPELPCRSYRRRGRVPRDLYVQ